MKIPKTIKFLDLIKLTWLDAFGKSAWVNWDIIDDGLKNHITTEIVGYYITEDKNFVVLSMGVQPDPRSNPFLHIEFIPKGSITEVKKIKG